MIARHLALFLAAALLVTVAPAAARPDEAALRDLHALVTDWQVAEARELLTPLLADDPSDPGLRFLNGRTQYFEGRYTEALHTLDALIGDLGEDAPPPVRAVRDEVARTQEALSDFDEVVSADGRFLIRFKGKDRLMVPYAEDTLHRVDAVLSQDFGYRPRDRIVVEIYPEIKYLAAVSPLTEEEIETSGTIALCKYNRLMITSPRALVRGYGWQDTLAHEFVHYYVTKVSRNTVPIWLHEGIAKFEESRAHAEPGLPLEPPQEDLLARSLREDKLITFGQMHPSMAKLPSQEAAALAFAEVHTVIGFLYAKKGYPGLNALISRLRAGDEMNAALRRAYGWDLDGLWTAWKVDLRGQGLRTWPGLVQTSLKFKRPGEADQPEAEAEADYDTIEEKKVKDFTHLGELLRARGRDAAALVEYQKAIVTGGDGNPVVQNGAAASMIALGRFDEVPKTLERVRLYYPTFVNTFLHLGEAFLHQNDAAQATASFEVAVGINPFHPRPHEALIKLYGDAGKPELAARAKKTLEMLQ